MIVWCRQGLWENFYQGIRRPISGPFIPGPCQDSEVNCYTGNWLTLVILGLITEKPGVRTFTLPGPSTYRARVRRTCCSLLPLVDPGCRDEYLATFCGVRFEVGVKKRLGHLNLKEWTVPLACWESHTDQTYVKDPSNFSVVAVDWYHSLSNSWSTVSPLNFKFYVKLIFRFKVIKILFSSAAINQIRTYFLFYQYDVLMNKPICSAMPLFCRTSLMFKMVEIFPKNTF